MGLDLWFQEDVARILSSVQDTMRSATRIRLVSEAEVAGSLEAGEGAPVDVQVVVAYQQGFADALRAVSIAFGLCAPGAAGRGGPQPSAPRALLQPRGPRESSS